MEEHHTARRGPLLLALREGLQPKDGFLGLAVDRQLTYLAPTRASPSLSARLEESITPAKQLDANDFAEWILRALLRAPHGHDLL